MGYIQLVDALELKKGFDLNSNTDLPYIYNVQCSVGRRTANMEHDVKLIQALLNLAGNAADLPNGPLVVDGKFGPKTHATLLHFQKTVSGLKVDGRVDKFDTNTEFYNYFYGPSKRFLYTIIALNSMALRSGVWPYLSIPALAPLDFPQWVNEMRECYFGRHFAGVEPVSVQTPTFP